MCIYIYIYTYKDIYIYICLIDLSIEPAYSALRTYCLKKLLLLAWLQKMPADSPGHVFFVA